MKSLKLNHQAAMAIKAGKSTSTWRINDDKDLHVNDRIQLIDKVEPTNPASWQPLAEATITSILEKRLGQVVQTDLSPNEKLLPPADLLQAFRTYYGPQVNLDTPVKIVNFSLNNPDTLGANAATVELYADGGSRGNPGPSASGYLLIDQSGKAIVKKGLYLGVTTNNQAEYQALKLGLEEARRRGATVVNVYMDSMLVVNQMKGVYQVKNSDLQAINRSIVELSQQFKAVNFRHVPRERNKAADTIVNEILDAS
jgi:ribonuclease HI